MALLQKKQEREALGAGQLPDDMGLLTGTFIMPYGKNRPSWFTNRKARWKLEKHRWWTRMYEVFALATWRYIYVRPRPRVKPFSTPALAKDLHHKMYTYFAAGNLDAIAPNLCPGLLSSLRARMGRRPPTTYLKWTLHRHLSRPRLVSLRSTFVPGPKEETHYSRNGVIQAIIRIHSLQSLQSVKKVKVVEQGVTVLREVAVDSSGKEIPNAPRPDNEEASLSRAKETVEYIVLQSVLRRSKMAPWMVWGTAEETSLRKLEKEEKKERGEKS